MEAGHTSGNHGDGEAGGPDHRVGQRKPAGEESEKQGRRARDPKHKAAQRAEETDGGVQGEAETEKVCGASEAERRREEREMEGKGDRDRGQ